LRKLGKFRDLWDRKLDGDDVESRSFFRYWIISTAVFLILICFVNQNNIIRWVRAGLQIKQQNKQIESYKQDIDQLDRKIQGITADKDSLEQFARENFHFAAPGDDVYIDPDK